MSLEVLIVEPHDLVRNEIRKFFSLRCPSTISAISDARDSREALRVGKSLRPNFVTLEIRLPDRAGLPLLQSLRYLLPDANIVVITLHDDRVYRERTAREGASDFVSKTHMMVELPKLLTQVARLTCAR